MIKLFDSCLSPVLTHKYAPKMMNHVYLQLVCFVEVSSTIVDVEGDCSFVATLGSVIDVVPELNEGELYGCIDEVEEAEVTGDGVGG